MAIRVLPEACVGPAGGEMKVVLESDEANPQKAMDELQQMPAKVAAIEYAASKHLNGNTFGNILVYPVTTEGRLKEAADRQSLPAFQAGDRYRADITIKKAI